MQPSAFTPPNPPADEFWKQMLTASTASAVFGVGVFAYVVEEMTGSARARVLVVATVLLAFVIAVGITLMLKRTRTASARRSAFFALGMLITPAMVYGIHLDGGLNSPLTLVFVPPAALAAAAFPPRDAVWHLGPIVAAYVTLLVLGPVPAWWVLAMGIGLFLAITVPVMIVRNAMLRYALAQERRAETLEIVSSVDGLTECLNHRAFHDALQVELDAAERGGASFSLVLIDIDRFKDVNDQHGHVTGDRVLIDVGSLLRSAARTTDAVGRIGGEEFALLLRRTSLPQAIEVAERLRADIARAKPAGIHVTISSGVAEYWPKASVPQLRRHADRLLYHAKADGRDTVVAGVPPPR
jgi:diguanylate cyclase (GGDEF)-like protein